MIDGMWAWGALGLVLLAVEMATSTFYVLWFGIAALCVAVAVWIFPNMPYAIQFAMFAILSLSALAIWRFHYKKTSANFRVGQSQGEEIGRVGTVIKACSASQNGIIRFPQGLMGSREWPAVCSIDIATHTEARVVAVEGNALRIEPI